MKPPVSQKELQELLHYDPTTGVFTRLKGTGKGAHVGAIAGSVTAAGYIVISVKGRQRMAHRLAWLYMTGQWPSGPVDHTDRDKTNNAWSNLRSCNKSQNAANSKKHCDNSTGFKGVRRLWNGSYQAILWDGSKQRSLGTFDNPQDASAAYTAAAQKHFGAFAYDGS